MEFAQEDAHYITITCLEWKPLLDSDQSKDIIIESLRFMVNDGRISVYAFVLMNNHLHMIWQFKGGRQREVVQRDFLKYTGQQILKRLRNESSPMLNELFVGAKDRKYQVWERKALSVPLYSESFFHQKLAYIHNNPVRAGLCKYPEEYRYSSASFYFRQNREFDFLTHFAG